MPMARPGAPSTAASSTNEEPSRKLEMQWKTRLKHAFPWDDDKKHAFPWNAKKE